MIVFKALAALVATTIGVFAALFVVASGVARNTTDPVERSYATKSAVWGGLVLVLCAGAVLTLTGCSTLQYAECLARDNTSRPCQ